MNILDQAQPTAYASQDFRLSQITAGRWGLNFAWHLEKASRRSLGQTAELFRDQDGQRPANCAASTLCYFDLGRLPDVSLANLRAGRTSMHSRYWLAAVGIVVLACAIGGRAAAQAAIGAVSRVQGEASGTAGGAVRRLAIDAPVFLNDVLSTGEGARLEIVFVDQTRMTLGERARLTLDSYVFDPAAGNGSIKFATVGAFRFLSGQLSRLASSEVTVTTPVATIGIRGTDFWGGPIDDQVLGVFLAEGAVSVSNAAGEQILNQPGQGTNISAAGAAPGPVTFWPADKVSRAIATVTFQ